MKPSSLKTISLLALLFAGVFGISSVHAASGTWSDLNGGSWANSANWSGGTIATGSGNTADFSTLTLGSSPTLTLDGAQTIGNLKFGDVGNAYGWTLNTGSGGPLTLAGTPVIIVSNQTTTVGLVLAGTVGLGKGGLGTLVLTGANTYTGTTTVTNGTVTYSGSGSYSGGSSANLNVGGATGSGVFNMNSSGTVSFTSGTPNLGGTGGATDTGVGAFYMNSGTVDFCLTGDYLTLGDEAPATQVSGMGTGAGFAYGYLNQSGGTITITASAGARVGGGGVGVWYQSGGVLTCPRYFAVGGNGSQGGNGIYTIVGGTATIGASGYYAILGGKPNATGIMDLGTEAGGTGSFTAGNGSGLVFLSDAAATNGTLNLNSGTLVMNGPIQRASANTTLKDTANVNCNGGTVQAAVGLPSLFTTNSGMTIKLYKGGLTIDSQTYNVTNVASLQNAPGNGFYPSGGTLAISSGGGSGYVGAPWVNVTSSAGSVGSNAMAIATLSAGSVSSVVITCPGENYQAGDVLNFAFINGGAATPATTYQYTIQASDLATNTGSLTKISAGSLTLSGASTYNGGTVVSAGTLYANAAGALGSGNVTVNNGATLVLTNATGLNYLNSGASLVVGSTGLVRLGYTGTDTINSLSLDGGNTFKTSGTWGAVGSSAANQSSQLTGTGILSVAPGQVATVSLNSSVNPSIYSQTVVLTTTVSGGSGTPTGTVNFMDGATTLATVTVNGAGQAAYTNTSFALGSHSLSVAYSGDHTYAPATSSTLTQTVNAGTDIWSGTVSSAWDINTTANWTALGNPVTYQDGSNVQLDDTAAGTTAIVLNTTVSPSSLLVTNSALAYSISGTGGIGGATTLMKLGTNTLTLNVANTFTGDTTVSNGAVTFTGSGSSSGAGNLNVGGDQGRGVFNMNSTGTINFTGGSGTPSIGGTGTSSAGSSTATGIGGFYMTSGTANLVNNNDSYLTLGDAAPASQVSGMGTGAGFAYGYLSLSGGTINISSTSGVRIGGGGVGVWYQSGGSVNCPRYFAVGGNNVQGGNGVCTLVGGTISVGSGGYYTLLGAKPNAIGILNIGTEAGGSGTFTATATA